MLRYLSLIMLLSTFTSIQRSVFIGQNFTPTGGGSTAAFVQYWVGNNGGVADAPAVISAACTTTGDQLTGFAYTSGSANAYSLAGMTPPSAGGQIGVVASYVATCPDTSSHTYTFSYTLGPPFTSGFATFYMVETTGALDNAPTTNFSPPSVTQMTASTTALQTSGMCIFFGWSNAGTSSWTFLRDIHLWFRIQKTTYFTKMLHVTRLPGTVTVTSPNTIPSEQYSAVLILVH